MVTSLVSAYATAADVKVVVPAPAVAPTVVIKEVSKKITWAQFLKDNKEALAVYVTALKDAHPKKFKAFKVLSGATIVGGIGYYIYNNYVVDQE